MKIKNSYSSFSKIGFYQPVDIKSKLQNKVNQNTNPGTNLENITNNFNKFLSNQIKVQKFSLKISLASKAVESLSSLLSKLQSY